MSSLRSPPSAKSPSANPSGVNSKKDLAKIQAAFGSDPVRGPLGSLQRAASIGSPSAARALQEGSEVRKTLTLTELAAGILPQTGDTSTNSSPTPAPRDFDALYESTPSPTIVEKLPPVMKFTHTELPNGVVEHLQRAIESHESSWRTALAAAEAEWKASKADALARAKARHEQMFREEQQRFEHERQILQSRIDEAVSNAQIETSAIQSRLESVMASNAELKAQIEKLQAEYMSPEQHKNELLALEIRITSREMSHKEEIASLKASLMAENMRLKAELQDANDRTAAAVHEAEVDWKNKLDAEVSRIQDVFAAQWREREDNYRRQWEAREAEFQQQAAALDSQLKAEQEAHAAAQTQLQQTQTSLEETTRTLESVRSKLRVVSEGVDENESIDSAPSLSKAKKLRRDTGRPLSSSSLRSRSSLSRKSAREAFRRADVLNSILTSMTVTETVTHHSSSSSINQQMRNDRSMHEVPADAAVASSELVADLIDRSPELNNAQQLNLPAHDNAAGHANNRGDGPPPFYLSVRTQQLLFAPDHVTPVIEEGDEEVDDDSEIDTPKQKKRPSQSTEGRSSAIEAASPSAARANARSMSDLERLAAENDDAPPPPPATKPPKSASPSSQKSERKSVSISEPQQQQQQVPRHDEEAAEELHAHIDELVQQYEAEAELCTALTSEVSRLTELSASLLRDNQELNLQLTFVTGEVHAMRSQLDDAHARLSIRAPLEQEIATANAAIEDLKEQVEAERRTSRQVTHYANQMTSMREQLAACLFLVAWMRENSGSTSPNFTPEAIIAEYTRVMFSPPVLTSVTVKVDTPEPTSSIEPGLPYAGHHDMPLELVKQAITVEGLSMRYEQLLSSLANLYPLADIPVSVDWGREERSVDELLRRIRDIAQQAAVTKQQQQATLIQTATFGGGKTASHVNVQQTVFEPLQMPAPLTPDRIAAFVSSDEAAANALSDALMQKTWTRVYSGLLALLTMASRSAQGEGSSPSSAQASATRISPFTVAQSVIHFVRAVAVAANVNADAPLQLLSDGLTLMMKAFATNNSLTTDVNTLNTVVSISENAVSSMLPRTLSPRAKDLVLSKLPMADSTWVSSLQTTITALTQQAADAQKQQGHTLAALALARETIGSLSMQLAACQAITTAVKRENKALFDAVHAANERLRAANAQLHTLGAQVSSLSADNDALRMKLHNERTNWALAVGDVTAAAFALHNEALRVQNNMAHGTADAAALEEQLASAQREFRRREEEWRSKEASLMDRLSQASREVGEAHALALRERFDEQRLTQEVQGKTVEAEALRRDAETLQIVLAGRNEELATVRAELDSTMALVEHLQHELQRRAAASPPPAAPQPQPQQQPQPQLQRAKSPIMGVQIEVASEEVDQYGWAETASPYAMPRRPAPMAPRTLTPSSANKNDNAVDVATTIHDLELARLQLRTELQQQGGPVEGYVLLPTPTVGAGVGASIPREKLRGSLVGVNGPLAVSRAYHRGDGSPYATFALRDSVSPSRRSPTKSFIPRQ